MSESTSERGVNESLSSITQGATVYVFGGLLGQPLKVLLNILLTRGLGASLYGIYAFAWTLISLVVIVARLGTGKSLLRYVPATEDEPGRQNGVVGLAYLTATVGSTATGAVLYVLAPWISAITLESDLLVTVLRIFGIALPFYALIKTTNAAFRSLERLEYQIIVADVIEPIVKIAVAGIALALGYALIGVVAALALAAATVCAIALSILYARTDLRPSVRAGRSRAEFSEFFTYSIPLTLKDVGYVLYTRVDVLMVGFFLVESAVGIYRIAVLVATFILLPLAALNQLFPPVASRLYHRGDRDQLATVYETITRWTLTAAIPLILVAGLYRAEVLGVFGAEFTAGTTVLLLFTVAQFANCAVGPSDVLLMMTDHQFVTMGNHWVLGVLNVILNYVFILEFGLIGAALASAGVVMAVNILRVVEVWHLEDMTPYSTSFWKPLAAGGLAGGVMYAVSFALEGYPLLVGGSLIGGLVFLGLLLAFGIEERDRDFFREVWSRRAEWR